MCRQASDIFAPHADQRKAEKFRGAAAFLFKEIAAIATAAGRRLVIWTVVLTDVESLTHSDLGFVHY